MIRKKIPAKHLVKGKKLHLHQNDKTLIHMRGMVDGLYIYCFWIKHKKRWAYKIEPKWFFDLYYDADRLTPKK